MRRRSARRGLVLAVVLVMITLLALLAAAYAFMVNAHIETVMSNHYAFQARMAADAGLQLAYVKLRESRADTDSWFDNPDDFRRMTVYSLEGEDEVEGRVDAEAYDATANEAWRFILVHPNYDERDTVRYGFRDEGSRLNLLTATEAEIRRLFEAVIPEDLEQAVDIDVLVDSLADWREAGNTPRANGAKDEYYQTLLPAYRCKKGPFATVEELLLVRGFTGWVVFGEDFNRNGLLDPNENDGDELFPPDNGDGELFPGVAPFLTVWSREMNMSSTNRQRINLNMQDTQKLQEDLSEEFDGAVVDYVMQVRSSGIQFNSVMNLLPAPPPPEEDEELPEEEPPDLPALVPSSQPAAGSENGNGAGSGAETTDPNGTMSGSENSAAPPLPVFADVTPEPPPGDVSDLPLILDLLTTDPVPGYVGRINVNTAPREVLATLEALTSEDLDAIVAARADVEGDAKTTAAWLLTESVIDEYTFRRILPQITTSSVTYRVEAVGFADHVGAVRRINTVFEMRGPIAQVLYQRDLTSLGVAYNPYGEERRGFADRSE